MPTPSTDLTWLARLGDDERRALLATVSRGVALGSLMGGIAHELNNPCAFIGGNVQLLQGFLPELTQALSASSSEEAEFILEELPEVLEEMASGVRRISSLVAAIRLLTSESSHGGQIEVEACLQEALELCRNELKYHVQISLDVDPCPPVEGASWELGEVFVAILRNAADAMEGGHGELKISLKSPGGIPEICFQDSGPGFLELDRIWEPFYTTRPGERVGLGLTRSQEIVSRLGGTLRCESNARGARVTVSLPSCAQEPNS